MTFDLDLLHVYGSCHSASRIEGHIVVGARAILVLYCSYCMTLEKKLLSIEVRPDHTSLTYDLDI